MKNVIAVVLTLLLSSVASATACMMTNGFDGALSHAMDHMDAGMKAAPMDGTPDHDFLTMMIPHHQGAIDMAESELQYGHDTRVKRLAREILVTQESEIQVMQLYLANARLQREKNTAPAPNTSISARDRFYLADQTSDTVSVVNPATNRLLGVIRLGQPDAAALGPLYTGQLLVHGMGFSPDHRTLVVVSVGSNSLAFIDTATNRVKHITYIGRAPHEAFFTQDGKEVWATVRGESYLSVIDANTYHEVRRIPVAYGPGMTIFSPDNRYAYECSSFTPETVVIDRHTYQIIGRVKQPSPFCPNITVTPDETQVWETLKDTGRVLVFDARPPFNIITTIDTGPITNHVNIVRNSRGQFAYVTIGGLNEVKVFTTDASPKLVATIPTGELPHGLWPSGDGSRVYVGLENADGVAVIDTLTNRVIATIHSGQSPQGVAYVPGAVPSGDGTQNLVALGASANAAHLVLAGAVNRAERTTVTINNQGVLDLLEAAVTGLAPGSTYTLGLAAHADGSGKRVFLATFKTNLAGAQIVTAIAPLRAMVSPSANTKQRRYVVIVKGENMQGSEIAQTEQTAITAAQR